MNGQPRYKLSNDDQHVCLPGLLRKKQVRGLKKVVYNNFVRMWKPLLWFSITSIRFTCLRTVTDPEHTANDDWSLGTRKLENGSPCTVLLAN